MVFKVNLKINMEKISTELKKLKDEYTQENFM